MPMLLSVNRATRLSRGAVSISAAVSMSIAAAMSSSSAAPTYGTSLYSAAGISLSPGEQQQLEKARSELQWMRGKRIWGPNPGETKEGRYLWTDAFGSVLLSSLYAATGDSTYLDENERLIDDVMATLGPGTSKGHQLMAISGRADEEDEKAVCSYAHYNSIFAHSLHVLSVIHPVESRRRHYHDLAIRLVKEWHPHFIARNKRTGEVLGVYWKVYTGAKGSGKPAGMPQPGKGLGGLDHYDLFSLYRVLGASELSREIADLEPLVMREYKAFSCSQDLGLGMMLHACHYFYDNKGEDWAREMTANCLRRLDAMWVPEGGKIAATSSSSGGSVGKSGYFCRAPWAPHVCVAFASAGAGIGVQAALSAANSAGAKSSGLSMWADRVSGLQDYLSRHYHEDEEYAHAAITWVMMLANRFPGLLLKSNLEACGRVVTAAGSSEQFGRGATKGTVATVGPTAVGGSAGTQPTQPLA